MEEAGAPIWEVWCPAPLCREIDRAEDARILRSLVERSERDELARLKAKYETDT